jgi:hypothetical protein
MSAAVRQKRETLGFPVRKTRVFRPVFRKEKIFENVRFPVVGAPCGR